MVIVILVAVVEVIVFGARAGLARGRNEVKAPAVVGNDEFERYFRVHYNTIEQMIPFLPSICFFGRYVNVYWAASLGAVLDSCSGCAGWCGLVDDWRPVKF